MDLELDDVQQGLVDAVGSLLTRHAGPARARALLASGAADHELLTTLHGSGYLDLAVTDGAGALEAVLVAEQAARHAAVAPFGARTLVAPHIADFGTEVVAIGRLGSNAPVRFATAADVIILVGDGEVALARPTAEQLTPVESPYAVGMARIAAEVPMEHVDLDPATARLWWQVAIGAEIVGRLGAALDLTTGYLKSREQFGRSLGSFQAIQHRLARLHIAIQGASWLTRSAAWGADPQAAAAAAVLATDVASWAPMELHQLTGAIGFTIEYDLHLWTMGAVAARQELGGSPAHARSLVAERWADLLPSPATS